MLKRLSLAALALALIAFQVAPSAIAAYSPPSGAFGPLTGDCTTASAGSTATTCSKTGGVAFGTMATQNAASVAITGGAFNGTVGATTPNLVYSAGEIGGTQSITGASGTVGGNVSFVNVNNSSAAVALAGPTSPVVGQHFTIKDGSGTSATNAITYTPGSGITIDGASSYVINQNRGAINVWVVSATVQAIY